MLYAAIEKNSWEMALPPIWDKTRSMFDYLNRMTWGYQLTFETKMFATPGPSIRCSLIRWESEGITRAKKRVALLDTDNPEQMESALFMLINEAEVQYRAAGNVRVMSMPGFMPSAYLLSSASSRPKNISQPDAARTYSSGGRLPPPCVNVISVPSGQGIRSTVTSSSPGSSGTESVKARRVGASTSR